MSAIKKTKLARDKKGNSGKIIPGLGICLCRVRIDTPRCIGFQEQLKKAASRTQPGTNH